MITIPTGDLTGILADVIPFAHTADDLPHYHAVHLEWTGQSLVALTTDLVQVGQSTWDPDDDDPDDETQDDLFTRWGGADNPWTILLALDDVKDLVTCFKLPAKEARAPLTVDIDLNRLTVMRSRESGHSALTAVIESTVIGSTGEAFPAEKLRQVFAADPVEKVEQIAYDPKRLATFAKVRPRGPMRLTFTGEHQPTRVTIGTRFVGAIQPAREETT